MYIDKNEELIRKIAYKHTTMKDPDTLENTLLKQLSIANEVNKELEERIEELERPWYVKLWNKIPKFKITIERVKP